MIRGLLFDLDGVIVDTAKYHFVAWQRMAAELGIHFGHEENEQLKGISRVESLERILGWGGIALSPEEKQRWMDQKKHLVPRLHRPNGPRRNSTWRIRIFGRSSRSRSSHRPRIGL